MNQETTSGASSRPRNRAALASLFISLPFFCKSVLFLMVIAVARWSSWATQLSKTNPDHPFFNLVEIVVELSVLLPLDLCAGVLAILFGVLGLRAVTSPSESLRRIQVGHWNRPGPARAGITLRGDPLLGVRLEAMKEVGLRSRGRHANDRDTLGRNKAAGPILDASF